MKKYCHYIVLVVAVVIGISTVHTKTANAVYTNNSMNLIGVVATQKDPLTMRQNPSASAKAIGSVAKGAKVWITAQSGDWYKVTANNKTGYVSKTYIAVDWKVNYYTKEKQGKALQAIPIVKTLEFTNKPSANLKKNEKVTIVGEYYQQYRVKTSKNVYGYVSKKYIQVVSSSTFEKMDARYAAIHWSINTYSKPDDSAKTKKPIRSMMITFVDQSTDGKWLRYKNNGKYLFIKKSDVTLKKNAGKQKDGSTGKVYYDRFYTDLYMISLEKKYLKFNAGEFVLKKTYDKKVKELLIGDEAAITKYIAKHGLIKANYFSAGQTIFNFAFNRKDEIKKYEKMVNAVIYTRLYLANNKNKKGVVIDLSSKNKFTIKAQ